MVVANETSSLLQFEVVHSSENPRWRILPGSIPAGEWTHVAATFDDSTARLYLNGAPAALSVFSSPSGNRIDNAGTGRIGNRADLAKAFAGRMDGVVLYSRALTSTEVQGMAEAAAGRLADSTEVRGSPASPVTPSSDWDSDGVPDEMEIFSGTARTDSLSRQAFGCVESPPATLGNSVIL